VNGIEKLQNWKAASPDKGEETTRQLEWRLFKNGNTLQTVTEGLLERHSFFANSIEQDRNSKSVKFHSHYLHFMPVWTKVMQQPSRSTVNKRIAKPTDKPTKGTTKPSLGLIRTFVVYHIECE